MRLRRYSIALYAVFVLLLVGQSVWWVVFLSREGENYGLYFMQRLRTDQLHAAYLLQVSSEIAKDPEGMLGETFPGLVFETHEDGVDVAINPAAQAAVQREVARRKRMFLSEGTFFLAVLLAGLGLVTASVVRETRFKRARELLLTGVTHEFKTPLASLSLYAETLSRPELDAARREGILGRMREDIERLGAMVEEVLAVSRSGTQLPTAREPLDLGEQARVALAPLRALIERSGATLETAIASGCHVLAQREDLHVAVRNLVDNALRHNPDGVHLLVSVRAERGRCLLSVEDDGVGIPRREHRRIFRSFYRVGEAAHRKPGTRGTGLGLHLVRRNVEAMGGRVEVESTLGSGSRFTLLFPQIATPVGQGEKAGEAGEKTS